MRLHDDGYELTTSPVVSGLSTESSQLPLLCPIVGLYYTHHAMYAEWSLRESRCVSRKLVVSIRGNLALVDAVKGREHTDMVGGSGESA